MPTKKQRRKRRRRLAGDDGRPSGSAPPVASATAQQGSGNTARARRGSEALPARRGPGRPSAPWGTFPLTEIVIFIGVLLLAVGFFIPPPQGFVMIAVASGSRR